MSNKHNIDLLKQQTKHEHKDRLCFHCNELQNTSDDLNHYRISNRTGDSEFDQMSFTIQLCEHCKSELGVDDTWFDNIASLDGETGLWLNEDCIINVIDSFPVCNQEYSYNQGNLMVRFDRGEWIQHVACSF